MSNAKNSGLEPMLIKTPEYYNSGDYRYDCSRKGISDEDADMEALLASKIDLSQYLPIRKQNEEIDKIIKYIERVINYIKQL